MFPVPVSPRNQSRRPKEGEGDKSKEHVKGLSSSFSGEEPAGWLSGSPGLAWPVHPLFLMCATSSADVAQGCCVILEPRDFTPALGLSSTWFGSASVKMAYYATTYSDALSVFEDVVWDGVLCGTPSTIPVLMETSCQTSSHAGQVFLSC